MSENLPYHDEWPDNLPLPDEEASWQKMKRLLEEKDKRRRLLPFWFWRYGLLGLLLTGGVAGRYFLLNKNTSKQTVAVPAKKEAQSHEEEGGLTEKKAQTKEKTSAQNIGIVQKSEKQNKTTDHVEPIKKEQAIHNKSSLQKTNRKDPEYSFSKVKTSPSRKRVNNDPVIKKEDDASLILRESKPDVVPTKEAPKKQADSLIQIDIPKLAIDSTSVMDSAKTMVAPPVVNITEKAKKKSRFLCSAGAGLQQPIALGGQSWSSRDTTGGRSRLLDLIPSAYLRVQKGLWVLQGEFYHTVSQPVRPFVFSQATTYDAGNAVLRTERLSVQKLQYRQALLSINRFVLPRWSVGLGGTYNLLAGAVAEHETRYNDLTSGNETVSKGIVSLKGYTDSFLYKSTVGLLLQTDFHYKRFSIGLRYSRNLQPFIKYTKADGTVLHQKNGLLQAVMRFRLLGRG